MCDKKDECLQKSLTMELVLRQIMGKMEAYTYIVWADAADKP